MIYVISSVGTQYVKIGVARNPLKRMRTLQVGIPQTLSLLAAADWPHRYEIQIHRALRLKRKRGEWFQRCEAIESLIKHMHEGKTFAEWAEASTNRPARLDNVLQLAAA